MGHIYKKTATNGRPRYYPIITIDGHRKSCGGHRTRKDAESALRRIESDIATGTYGLKPKEAPTFSEFAEQWLEEAEHRVKPRTCQDYRQVVRTHLLPPFGNMKLGDISVDAVQKYTTAKAGQVSPRTVNKTLVALGAILKDAMNRDLIDKNPVSRVKKLRQPQEEMDFLDPGEVRRLIDATPERERALITAAAMTGLRQGELLGLRWGDYGSERGVLFVRRTYRAGIGYGEPKSKQSRRAVQVPDVLCEQLDALRKEPDAPMFPAPGGAPWEHANLIRRVFHPALVRAGLRRIRFHDLRHTYAALMVSQGVNLKWLQHQMGHASITTTLDLYGHLLPDTGAGAANLLGDLVTGKVGILQNAPRRANCEQTEDNQQSNHG